MDSQRSNQEQQPRKDEPKAWVFPVAVAVLSVVFFVSSFVIVSYIRDFFASISAANELRKTYYTTQQPSVQQTEKTEPRITAAPTPGLTIEPGQTPAPAVMLSPKRYPTNEFALVSSRFQRLQRQNADIIGWLNIPGLLDEAVVQRDNTYYLARDYRGYHNVNGAIFMDESINLQTRPYTLVLYGHNMKTGVMFGSLRNYDHQYFYHSNPFITFDSAYEDGRYVIFSIATIGMDAKNVNYVDLTKLNSSTIEWRMDAIHDIIQWSEYGNLIDIRADDQILLLVTCVEDFSERRIVAARRVREGESEEELARLVSRTRKKQ